MFACIHIPDFPYEAIARHEPDLRRHAVAVVDGKPPVLKAVSMNELARRTGIPMGAAELQVTEIYRAMVRRRSLPLETSAHAALLDCASTCSPRVESTEADTVILDADGLDTLFGSPEQLARYMTDQARHLGLDARIAVASNPDACVHAARGFPGITVLPPGLESTILAPLPLHILRAPEVIVEALHRWGIRTLGEFGKLRAREVAERFGQDGVKYHNHALGRSQRPLRPVMGGWQFEESMDFDYRIQLLEQLSFVLKRLTDALCARLTARSLATHTLRLYLRLDTGSTVERSLVLPMPMRDARTLHRLLHMDLEGHPPGSTVTGVRLLAEPVQPRVVQNGLFVPLAPEPEKLELTLARIGHIVGKDRLGAVELLDTHRPDAFVLKRFDAQASRGQAVPERRPFPAAPIALRHFRPPIDAGVTLRWGAPARIAFQHVHERILTASGPWRNTGGWWQDEPWARDEWDISIVTSGQSVALYRICLDLSSQRWFVEGIYD